ncbi:MAG: DNA repair protein RadA, partial [Gemmatimonadota bacterium]|nr:DNA repair protein RadA [Gemmatimonadota bacterium]
MTPRAKTVYRCTECGAEFARWQGRCDVCGEWNTLVEEIAAPKAPPSARSAARRTPGSSALA